MRSSDLLRAFLALGPDLEMLKLPVYFTDKTGCPKPLAGCAITDHEDADGALSSVVMLYDRKSRRASKALDPTFGQLWAKILAARSPQLDAVIGVFQDTGCYEAFSVFDVKLLQVVNTSERIVCITPAYFEFE